MTDPTAVPLSGPLPTHFGRRVIARLLDDAILVGLSIVIAVTMSIHVGDGASASGLFYGGPDARESGWTAYAPLGDEGGGHPASAILMTGVYASLLFIAYVILATFTRGATPGKIVTGLRVTAADGSPALRRVVAGRECLRVASVGLALALVAPVISPLSGAGSGIFGTGVSTEIGQVVAAMSALLPIGIVAAGLLGAALVHPAGRALHDRLAGTRVVGERDRIRAEAAAPTQ